MLLFLVFLIILTPFIWWYLFVLRKFRNLAKIPGPNPLPVLGNVLDIGNKPEDFHTNLKKINKRYGDTFKIYIGSDLRVFITRPELLEKLLSSNVHITKSNGYDVMYDWLREGLITSTGRKWKIRRRMITTTFHFKILDEFMDKFNSCGDILIRKLSSQTEEKPIDIYPFLNLCAFDAICQTSMGLKYSLQEQDDTKYVEMVREFLNIALEKFFSAWQRNEWLFRLFSKNAQLHDRSLEILNEFADEVIKKRREKISRRSENSQSESDSRKKAALLDMLLQSEDSHNLSNEDIKEEINTILFAGHDTTSSSMAFALLCLAEHPDIQERVYDEIMTVMGDDQTITKEHINRMKYLEMVIKESQRVYPTVPFVERRLEQDWIVDGYHFPKDTILTIYIQGVHQNAEFYPDPEKFDPDRFTQENQSKRHVYSYIPFSAGPRNCVGQKFAMLASKTVLIKILRNFRLKAVPDFKPKLGLAAILKSYNGVYVQLQKRQW